MSHSANPYPGLPPEVLKVIDNAIFTEFATMTNQGVPLDTPLFCFRSADGRSIDVTTGLAYPVKAERARRNPKVGLLIEGGPGQPVVSIAALAAVRDADLQANVDRYLSEVIAYLDTFACGNPWSVARQSIWYWTRILIFNTPRRILWWPDASATDQTPQRWDAPAYFNYPPSDPAPAGPAKNKASWPVKEWSARAKEVLDQGMSGHITLVDDEGFPLPFRTRGATLDAEGFILDVPAGAPWKIQGKASLCFDGRATFIGDVEPTASGVHFKVERMMPDLPLVQDSNEIWNPRPETREQLMARLEEGVARRGQAMPSVPLDPPQSTEGGKVRAAIMAQYARMAAQGSE